MVVSEMEGKVSCSMNVVFLFLSGKHFWFVLFMFDFFFSSFFMAFQECFNLWDW